MGLVEKIKLLCNEKNVTFAEVERKVGISNGQIRRWDNSSPKIENVQKVADYFDVSTDYLLGRTNKKRYNDALTEKDEKDIAKRMAKIRQDLMEGNNDDGLAFSGEPMSEEAIESLLEALEFIERQTTKINKKYIPKGKRN
ncbi:helix-turn-helix domain-containing protein [Ornithinibacillus sp. 4-3]|uniref:Helix-turn-helix domain-containing protein n=1 Tax=Ornithinibacillus sp. 4-3 TaxID=3231488 RepID=A0AB39HMC4_9BACI